MKIGPEKIKMCANLTQKRGNVCKLEKIKCVPETIWFEYGTPQQVVTACQESESFEVFQKYMLIYIKRNT